MVEPQRHHVLIDMRWKDSVLASCETVTSRQRDDACRVDVIAFVGRKQVRPVPCERTTNGAARPLFVKRRLSLREGVPRVERIVAAEVERASLKLFTARPGDYRHDRVQRIAVLGVELVAKDSELLHAFLRDIDRRASPLRVVNVAAVQHRRKTTALVGRTTELGRCKSAYCRVKRSRTR